MLLAALVCFGTALLLELSGSPDQGTHARAKAFPGGISARLRDPVIPLPVITSDR